VSAPLSSVAERLQNDPMWAVDDAGRPITREMQCACGRAFTQRKLSERFLRVVAAAGARSSAVFTQQIPDGWLPLWCPPCERNDLGNRAKVDAMRRQERNGNPDWTDR
jgi:hypothetical protein